MAVIGILSLLLGLGIGFVSRMNPERRGALGILKARISAARNTARIMGKPSWVNFFEKDGRTFMEQGTITPVLYIGFENGAVGAYGMNGKLEGGRISEGGRFGLALEHEQPISDAMNIDTAGRDYMKLEKGFMASVDIKPSALCRMILFKWGPTFEIGLDERGRPYANLTLEGKRNAPGKVLELGSRVPLTIGEWKTIEVSYDCEKAILMVGGEKGDLKPEKGIPFVKIGVPMTVSSGKAPVRGLLDEIKLFAVSSEEPEPLPKGVRIKKGPKRVRFIPGGFLDPFYHGPGLTMVLSFERAGEREVEITRLGVVK